MTISMKKLRNDFKSFLRDEHPPQSEMEKAPLLEEWVPAISRSADEYRLTLVGKPIGHPMQPDGKEWETTEVVWLDRRGRWARTRSRLWRLGKPAGTEIPIDGVDL
jgi:hypothetical protein